MKIWLIIVILFFSGISITVPVPAQEPAALREQSMEANAENAGTEGLDDDLLQLLEHYRRAPLNLNTATEGDLQELMLLTALQIKQLVQYRRMLGPLRSRYELQAIPGWDLAVIEQLLPYITVSDTPGFGESVLQRLKGGQHSLLLRVAQSFRQQAPAEPVYPGSPQRVLLRYRYQFKNTLQYGVLAEKDPGESWGIGARGRGGGFFSAHLFTRNAGLLRVLALGDFTVNMGQGLLIWQSLAFRKGAEVMQIRRQSAVLRPYHAAGEYNFHRGLGCTIGTGRWQFTGFASLRNLDGNREADSVSGDYFITSLQQSGLHRTRSEVSDRGAQRQFTLGGALAWNRPGWHLGLNALHYRFGLPFRKQALPYNKYAMAGTVASFGSLDFNLTYRNLHLFGELAASPGKPAAILMGGLISLAPVLDLSIVYRYLPPGHQPLQANAFSENTLPSNETGFFTGISIRPAAAWRLDAYTDLFRFPWLRFRADAPGSGMDCLVQLLYRPGKQLETSIRFRSETKEQQVTGDLQEQWAPALPYNRKQLRWQLQYHLSPELFLRCRADLSWYRAEKQEREEGILLYADLQYKRPFARWSLAGRLQYFETAGFNSRLYAYEQDVLYSFSIPAFQGQGFRYYLLVKYRLSTSLGLWARVARTIQGNVFNGEAASGGGNPTDCTLQLQFRF